MTRPSTPGAMWMWAASRCIHAKGRFSDSEMTWGLRLGDLAFQGREEVARR